MSSKVSKKAINSPTKDEVLAEKRDTAAGRGGDRRGGLFRGLSNPRIMAAAAAIGGGSSAGISVGGGGGGDARSMMKKRSDSNRSLASATRGHSNRSLIKSGGGGSSRSLLSFGESNSSLTARNKNDSNRSLMKNGGGGDSGDYVYRVQVFESPNALATKFLQKNEIRTISGIPRKYIEYADRPYQSDQHLPHAFRHEMRSLEYPEAWLDRIQAK